MRENYKKLAAFVVCVLFVLGLGAVLPGRFASATEEGAPVPRISSSSAIVMDFETGEVLFERNAHVLRAPASMTKAMTAFVVYEEIEAGNLNLDTMVPVSANAARISSDTNMQGAPFPLRAGSYISVDMMLHLMMLPSSNGACVAMAEYISGSEAAFAVRMNESARAIGMTAYFTNAHGALPHDTTAYSIGVLVREFIARYPDILRITGATHVDFGGSARNNTNLLVRPSEFTFRYADGFRTGTTREAGFCLSSTAYRNGRRVVVVTMGGANNQDRYGDSRALLEWGLTESLRRYNERQREIESRISVVLEGEQIEFDVQPQIVNNRVMVPMRDIFEALGATVGMTTEDGVRVIRAVSADGHEITLAIGEYVVSVDGAEYVMDVAPMMVDGATLVPLRLVAEALDRAAAWDRDTRTAYISANGAREIVTPPSTPAPDAGLDTAQDTMQEAGEDDDGEDASDDFDVNDDADADNDSDAADGLNADVDLDVTLDSDTGEDSDSGTDTALENGDEISETPAFLGIWEDATGEWWFYFSDDGSGVWLKDTWAESSDFYWEWEPSDGARAGQILLFELSGHPLVTIDYSFDGDRLVLMPRGSGITGLDGQIVLERQVL